MKHIQQAGGIVLNNRGEIALITSKTGRQTLPKGAQEPGETLIDTARREIKEETGLTDLTIHQELGVITRHGFTIENTTEPSVMKHIHIFLCTTDQTELQPQEDDVLAAYWVSQNKVADTLSWPEEAEFFEQHRSKLDI